MNKVTHGDRLWVFTAVNFTRADISKQQKKFVHMHVHIDSTPFYYVECESKDAHGHWENEGKRKNQNKVFWMKERQWQSTLFGSCHHPLSLALLDFIFFSLVVVGRCAMYTVDRMYVCMDGWMDVCAIDIIVWNITSTKAIAVSQQIWALELSSQTEWIEHTQSIVLWIAFYICTESWLPFFLHRLNRFCTLIRSKLLLVLSF